MPPFIFMHWVVLHIEIKVSGHVTYRFACPAVSREWWLVSLLQKFYGVPPCDVDGEVAKSNYLDATNWQENRSNELTVDYPCLIACKRQWKWYPLCVRVLRWCMDGKSRILAKLLRYGLTGLTSINEWGQPVELFCMIPLATSSSQHLLMLGGIEPIFSSLYCKVTQIDGNGSVDA